MSSYQLLRRFLFVLVAWNCWELGRAASSSASGPVFGAPSSLLRGFRRRCKNRTYTPLVFFTVPNGLMPECDALESCVRQVEDDLNVQVERLDVLRTPESEAVLSLLTSKTPPFLYHRESCQVIHIPKGGRVDYQRVRAWAKGRYLPPPSSLSSSTDRSPPPVVLSQDGKAVDQDELLEEALLTPLQREGKRAIQERTDAQASKGVNDSS